jgi:superfamily II DNA/RNA helicase
VHRIGRTGRAGREGRAFTLATPYEGKYADAIVKLIGRDIPRIEIEGITQFSFEAGDGKRHRGRRRGGDRHETKAKPEHRQPGGRREHRARSERPPVEITEARPAPRPETRAQTERPERRRRRPEAREHEDDTPMVAFGDHMPDFLRRPVKLPSPPKKKADAA